MHPDPVLATDEEIDAVTTDDNTGLASLLAGVVGYAVAGPGGAVASSVFTALLSGSSDESDDHDEILARAVAAAVREGPESASLYVEHLADSDTDDMGIVETGETTYGIVPGVNGYPDVVYIDGAETGNAIVEVEDEQTLHTRPDHVVDQLEDYRGKGFRTTLVVEANAGEEAHDWLMDRDDVDAGVYVVEAPAFGRFV